MAKNPSWYNKLKKPTKVTMPEQKPRTRAEVITEFNQAAIGLVQRMQLVGKMQQEVDGITRRLNELEIELANTQEASSEKDNNPQAPAASTESK
jgi:hypothetical protein